MGATELHVVDVVKENGIFLHVIDSADSDKLADFEENAVVTLEINTVRRNQISRGHSATHLMQQALRDVLGDHVMQAGSYVDENYLRFDFNHFEAMTADEIRRVEDLVNEKVDSFLPIQMQEMPIEEAKKLGAMALFGEKYGDIVRVVSMGDYSIEFCGGTHLDNTGKIGGFKIISEYGVASGVRRVEAVTGSQVIRYLNDKLTLIDQTTAILKTTPKDLPKRAEQLLQDNRNLEKEIKSLKSSQIADSLDDIIASAKDVNGVKLITKKFTDTEVDQLREMSDAIKGTTNSVAMVFATVNGDKANLIVSLSEDLVSKGYHAGKIIKEVAKVAGGGGGGKANMAQAGAKDITKLDAAFAKAEELIAVQ